MVRQKTYARIYRKTPTMRMFDAAKRIEGLDESTAQAIVELEQQYLVELDLFNEQLLRILRKHEPELEKNKVEIAAARISGERPQRLDDPMRTEFQKRRELGDRYVQELKTLLTPPQFAALPGARRWLGPDDPGALKGKGLRGSPVLEGRGSPTTQPES